MAKQQESGLALLDPVDTKRPLVKEFVDCKAKITKFLQVRLPSVSKTIIKVHQVYASKDARTYRYRVNYHQEETYLIIRSCYVQVYANLDDDTYELTDITQ